ncbi:MAG: hypothetical protein ACRDSI_01295 [Pseudonocardiaceae bacterium]
MAELTPLPGHPLDHFPLSRRCRSLPGGVGRHIAFARRYKWPAQLNAGTLCRFGYHRMVHGWTEHDGQLCSICRYCCAPAARPAPAAVEPSQQ